jgi:hypothetical protein
VSASIDRFFDTYYQRRPVNATFTGVHAFDDRLPDWTPTGLASLDDEMRGIIRELDHEHPLPATDAALRADVDALDAELARSFLEIQIAENASGHGVRGNPSLWIGEAVFGVISLMIRDFAPLDDRICAVTARLAAIPEFLHAASITIGRRTIPASWIARARKECKGALALFDSMQLWLDSALHDGALDAPLRSATRVASTAVRGFDISLGGLAVAADDASLACGAELYDLLLARGHHARRSRADLLAEARERFAASRARLDAMAAEAAGSWSDVQGHLAADAPAPTEFLETFGDVWSECRDVALAANIVTWPDWPIQYVPFPRFTATATPNLYYLYYRSPAPFDPYVVYDYVVPPVPTDHVKPFLMAWNHATIKLNHVVHHGAIGHHVQNWHAYHRASSRVGRIAAVDCASRIGMFCGGTMAEGWACYATGLMEELDFVTPLERVAEQHSRVRFLARAIVDIELHQGTMTFEDAVAFYITHASLAPEAARAEAVKNSMFPATAVMYWLGTQTILDLRASMQPKSLKAFHDELLGFGSIPLPLVARMMMATSNG